MKKRQSHAEIHALTSDEFAAALSRLVGEAEDAGVDPEKVLAEIDVMAESKGLHIEVRAGRMASPSCLG